MNKQSNKSSLKKDLIQGGVIPFAIAFISVQFLIQFTQLDTVAVIFVAMFTTLSIVAIAKLLPTDS